VITPRTEENAAFYSPHRYDHNHGHKPNYSPNYSGDKQQQAGISVAGLAQHHNNDATAAVQMVMDILARAEEGEKKKSE
jgi:hypothetical protein